jgi:hypothetical protein
MVKTGISEEQAEKRAITAKLPEKYQNECTDHIATSSYNVFSYNASSYNVTNYIT